MERPPEHPLCEGGRGKRRRHSKEVAFFGENDGHIATDDHGTKNYTCKKGKKLCWGSNNIEWGLQQSEI